MATTDPRVDTIIQNSADFAKPILNHLRQLIHQVCPDATETIKWGFPHFEHNGLLCSMAAFKQHCAFTFWKANLLSDPHQLFSKDSKTSMGQLGQLKSLTDLPADIVLVGYIQEAVKLNLQGVKGPAKFKPAIAAKALEIPEYLAQALKENEAASNTFSGFSNSNKKEYITWLAEAKTEATRQKRLLTAIEWIAEGKPRNWKYIKK
ncbi:YdeI/OmpD-associated family protein [Adhaeribacter aquaticus]|uniref:YdeI/OmpD-associated family protein n=1 Tax=Adhaeribacter aquaticus TaxID=299567 RepID=UPI000414EE86|nr:YdeI/OmpD-associated family protein [Adhaeribacter aquaticus]